MNFYPRYVGDYARDTSRLSLAQHGAYTLLLDDYYGQEQPLPPDLDALYSICRAVTDADRDAVRVVAERFFPKNPADGLRHNTRADTEIAKKHTLKTNGKKGADARWHGGRDGPEHGESDGKQHGPEHGPPDGEGHGEKHGIPEPEPTPLPNPTPEPREGVARPPAREIAIALPEFDDFALGHEELVADWKATIPPGVVHQYTALANKALQENVTPKAIVEAMTDWTANTPTPPALGLWREYIRKAKANLGREVSRVQREKNMGKPPSKPEGNPVIPYRPKAEPTKISADDALKHVETMRENVRNNVRAPRL